MIIYIYNKVPFHYEIIISIIEKYNIILSIEKNNDQIFLSCINNLSFISYIKQQYPEIILDTPKNYDYIINCTIYNSKNLKNDSKHYYISHNISKDLLNMNNVWFLTPLCNNLKYIYCDILPFQQEKIKSSIPIYIIQGNIENRRRNYNLLIKILSVEYEYKFKILIVGKGKLSNEFNKYSNLIEYKYNYNFIDFHKQFLDCYCILPLITKKSHKQYYINKLTSSINYGKAYQLKFLIDKDLQDIYKLDNVEIFNNTDDICDAFNRTLEKFYNIQNSKGLNIIKEQIKKQIKCERETCNFECHPNLKNNGGTHCCRGCKEKELHGPACKKKEII
jgi:hypothetical protein